MSYDKYQEVFNADPRLEDAYQRIKAIVLDGKTPAEEPVAVVLGGLPGSGKGNIYRFYKNYADIDNNIVELDCDAMRKFHPDVHTFAENEMAYKTNDFVFASVERLIAEEIVPNRLNYITESAMKRPDTAFQTANDLKPHGYRVELAVMATKIETAWQGTIARYEAAKKQYELDLAAGVKYPDLDPPRPVPREFFDDVAYGRDDIPGIEKSFTMIYESRNENGVSQIPVDDITIYTREGDVLYNRQNTPELDPAPILSARLHNDPEAANTMIAEYVRTTQNNTIVENLNDIDKFNAFLHFQGGMHEKTVDTALIQFNKGYQVRLSTNDWRLSEVIPEALKKELELPEDKSIDVGLVRKFVDKQSIVDLAKELGVPEERSHLIAFASRYMDVVKVMINGRLDEGGKNTSDPIGKEAHSFFQSLDTKQKLCFLEHCKADASKALEATGRTIDKLTNSNPHL